MDAILQGQDHTELGAVAVQTVADDLVIGLTRGLLMKSYAYIDPNEDVVAARRRDDLTALVVADGHNGRQGSHTAVDFLLGKLDGSLAQLVERRAAVTAFHGANERMRVVRQQLQGAHRHTRTTMVLALVQRSAEGTARLVTASVGDSVVIVVGPEGARQVTRDRHRFLGDRLSAPEMAGSMHSADIVLAPDQAVVVASDGLTNFAAIHDIGAAVDRSDPEVSVRRLIELAGRGGAGDNVAVGVLSAPRP